MRYLKTYTLFERVSKETRLFEDIDVDKSNLQKMSAISKTPQIGQIFDDNFIKTISDMCLELDDLGYQVDINFPEYHKEIKSNTEILPSCCVEITSQEGYFLNNKALEMTIKEIQSYVSEFDLNVDIEIVSGDQFVTADEFIENYNVEELDSISILIYLLKVENLRNLFESNKRKLATKKELDTIEQILFGIEDLDFDVEIHKNIGGQNKRLEISSEVCRVYIENFAVNFTPDDEFLSVLKHLVSYVDEIEYDIKIQSVLDYISSTFKDSEVEHEVNSKYTELTDIDIERFGQSNISYVMITISYKD